MLPRVLAVIDTSGSISNDLLERIAGGLRRLARSHKVIVCECDAAIRNVYPFLGKLETVRGRGCTDLQPLLEAVFLCRHKPDVIAYYTDRGGPVPEKPPRVPLVWCLTATGVTPAPWGRLVCMRS
jgi:predicted metal-dependent peptidase